MNRNDKSMVGAVSWRDMRAELPRDVQDRLDEKRRLHRLGAAMAGLRRQTKLTQSELAERAGVPQGNVSRTETSEDMLVSSIGRYMQALGGSAELVLRNAEGEEVHIDISSSSEKATG